jgi:hypothetical protein
MKTPGPLHLAGSADRDATEAPLTRAFVKFSAAEATKILHADLETPDPAGQIAVAVV